MFSEVFAFSTDTDDISRKRKRRQRRRFSRFEPESPEITDSDSNSGFSSDDSGESCQDAKKLRTEVGLHVETDGARSAKDRIVGTFDVKVTPKLEGSVNIRGMKYDQSIVRIDQDENRLDDDVSDSVNTSVKFRVDSNNNTTVCSDSESLSSSSSESESDSKDDTYSSFSSSSDEESEDKPVCDIEADEIISRCPETCACKKGINKKRKRLHKKYRKMDICEPLYKKLLNCRLLRYEHRARFACCNLECDRKWAKNRLPPECLGLDYAHSDFNVYLFSWGSWKS